MSNLRQNTSFGISIIVLVISLLVLLIQLVGVSFADTFKVDIVAIITYIATILLVIFIYNIIKKYMNKKDISNKYKRYIKYGYILCVVVITRVIALFAFRKF